MEKKKKKKIPFDKIDITTATDDDIIRSGISHNTSKDVICYLIMFCIFVLALLPVFLRVFMPREKTTEERDVVYLKLTCFKTTVRDNYELTTAIVGNYRDSLVNNMSFEFKYFKRNDEAEDGYIFTEINEFERLKYKGITSNSNNGAASFVIDFENNPELEKTKELNEYAKNSMSENKYLTGEKGYNCSSTSEIKKEVVNIETGKKVK